MLLCGCRKKENIECNYNIHLPDTAFKKTLVASRFFNSNGVEEYIDKDGDGEICDGEAIRPTELSFCNSNIQSFEGIQHFTNLKQLNIIGCNLDSLSISSSSLIDLYCNDMQLIHLDVSNVKNLERLHCSGNKLTEIDLSMNVNLKVLGCCNNQLTTINLSKNVKLITITFRNNLVSYIDLSKNINLTTIDYGKNPISEIDFSNNPELVNIGFGDNPMPVLDISENYKVNLLKNYGEFPFEKICVWTLPFPPSGITIQTLNFPDDFDGFEICD
jgi:hypothetical protein